MRIRRRHVALYLGLAITVVPLLALLLEEAGHGVALAVAIAALAAVPVSYALIGLAIIRSYGHEDANKREMQRRARAHIPIMFGMPLVVIAAHPWGLASGAVALMAMFLCQGLFLHTIIVTGLILRRRDRATTPRPSR
jgi:hypothetical protein